MEVNPNLSEKAKRDYGIVQLALKGDQKAYADLLELYRDSIYFMLLKMVNNKSDAEDLTIEAFGKSFKNLEFYTPNFAFSTWLFKIATNNAIDFLRKKKAQQKHISIDHNDDDEMPNNFIFLQSNIPDPEEKLIIKQREMLMHNIVKKLNPRYRQIITMRYFNEMSYIEIAQELDLPIGTVKARLHRSRELLLNTLKDKNISID